MAEEDEEKKQDDSEETKKKEKKQLKNVFVIVGILVLIFLGTFILINSSRQFTYRGVDFEVVKQGNLILYKTSIPVDSKGVIATGRNIAMDYNFYLRNDPRTLKNVPYDVEELVMRKNVLFNFTESFSCNGYGVIGIVNLQNLMTALGTTPGKNESAKCEETGDYTFIQLQAGEETGIEQTGKTCYNLNINNCEALKVTEKLMVEMFARVNEQL